MKCNKLSCSFLISLFYLICGCNLNGQSLAPYKIEVKLVQDVDNVNYENMGLDCCLYNLTDKEINSFNLSFTLFDENGIPINKGTYEISGEVKPNDYIVFCLNIDELVKEIENKICYVDFVYISKINYKDDSTWSDPFGIKYYIE